MQGTRRVCITDPCTDDAQCQGDEHCETQREPRVVAGPTVLAAPDGDPDAPPFAMWVEMSHRTADDRAIWRAISNDGVSWRFAPADPVLEDAGDAHDPSVAFLGGEYHLLYERTGGIAEAIGSDGVSFGAPSTYLSGDVHAPAATPGPDGELMVFVEVGAREGIGLVTGGTVVTILEPFDVTDPILWREVQTIGSPYILVDETELGEPTVRLWFDAFGEESASAVQFGEMVPTPPNDSIGYASAPAGEPARMVVWPFNPIFDRVLTFLEHRAERSPAVVRVPGTEAYFLYYEGSSTDGTEQDGLGVARTPAAPD
jgi:hypothetical protein